MAYDHPGQPTKYKPEYCEQLIKHMSEGMSFESFGGILQVDKQTLYNWREMHSEFFDSYKKGLMISLAFWEKIGNAATLGKVPGFNATSWIFNMKNRFKWKDRIETEVGGIMDENGTRQEIGLSINLGQGFMPANITLPSSPDGSATAKPATIQGADLAQARKKNIHGNKRTNKTSTS